MGHRGECGLCRLDWSCGHWGRGSVLGLPELHPFVRND